MTGIVVAADGTPVKGAAVSARLADVDAALAETVTRSIVMSITSARSQLRSSAIAVTVTGKIFNAADSVVFDFMSVELLPNTA